MMQKETICSAEQTHPCSSQQAEAESSATTMSRRLYERSVTQMLLYAADESWMADEVLKWLWRYVFVAAMPER
jgi:hypothetical protein